MNVDIAIGVAAGIPVGGAATALIWMLWPQKPKPIEPEQLSELIQTVRQITNLEEVQRNRDMQLKRARRKTQRTDNTNPPARVFRLRSGTKPRESRWASPTDAPREPIIVVDAEDQ